MRFRYAAPGALAMIIAAAALSTALAAGAQTSRTWTLGEDAETKKNPRQADEKTLAEGAAIFRSKCARCHGPKGVGDGPDGDPTLTEMNLTNPKRAARNTDGVVYYKVLNGRGRPKMPAFKEELTEQQIWAVVTYVQTLRQK